MNRPSYCQLDEEMPRTADGQEMAEAPQVASSESVGFHASSSTKVDSFWSQKSEELRHEAVLLSFKAECNAFVYSPCGIGLHIAFLSCSVALLTFLIVMGFTSYYTEQELWYYVLQACFDVVIVLEVLVRMLYFGKDYFRDCWNYVDLAIVVLCVMATVSENLELFSEHKLEQDTALALRIARDILRALRLVVFIRFLQRSIVSFQECEPDLNRDQVGEHVGVWLDDGFEEEATPRSPADFSMPLEGQSLKHLVFDESPQNQIVL